MKRTTVKSTITWVEYDADTDEETPHELPATVEVCDACGGKGTHVNPNIDGHGISQEEWEHEWDDEERETYLSGGYDVVCHTCEGARVVTVLDRETAERVCPDLLKKYDDWCQAEWGHDALCRAERAMGA